MQIQKQTKTITSPQIIENSKKAYEDAKKAYEDAKKEYDTYDTIQNKNKSDIDLAKEKIDKANLVYDNAIKYAKVAAEYASIVHNTTVAANAIAATDAVNKAKAERIKNTTAYFKLVGAKKGGRRKTHRKYRKTNLTHKHYKKQIQYKSKKT